MPYKISKCKPKDVICQCGDVVKWHDMPKHILTTSRIEGLIGREHIEVIDHYKY